VARPRHPKPELEAVLREAERRAWRIEKGKKYFKMRCPCEQKRKKTVRLTPSDPKYTKNLLGQLKHATCWEA
jgi:hypothetical protein